MPAFRAPWDHLGAFRIRLSKTATFQVLSGTFPPHIITTVIRSLLFRDNWVKINVSSNRPNIIYATHPIVGSLSDFRNLDFLIPVELQVPLRLQNTIIFHDDTTEANNAALYLNSRLPKELQKLGLVMQYHSGMSKDYLEKVYDSFRDPEGTCVILCATAGAATVLYYLYSYIAATDIIIIRELMCLMWRSSYNTV